MSEPKKPSKEEIEQIAAAVQEEVIDSSLTDLLRNAKPEDLVGTTPGAEVRKTTALPSSCWIFSPGNTNLLSVAYGRLVRTAGANVKYVDRVYARFVKGTKILVILPAPPTDLTAYEVKRYKTSGAWVNLSGLLMEHRLTVEPGWKERYAVSYIPKGSPLGKGIFINLGEVQERRLTRKKDEEEQAEQK